MLKQHFPKSYLASPGKPITRLSNTDVHAEFPDPQVPHGVLSLILATLDHNDLSEIRQEFRRHPGELQTQEVYYKLWKLAIIISAPPG